MKSQLGALIIMSLFGLWWQHGHGAQSSLPAELEPYSLKPIGRVSKIKGRTQIALLKQYELGLLGLSDFSHVYVFWWFNGNDTPKGHAVLQVHPRGNPANPLTGVFATRSPRRPNLIAMTLCKIVSVHGNVLELEAIDAFSGTPVFDLKPFIPNSDSAANPRTPAWLREK